MPFTPADVAAFRAAARGRRTRRNAALWRRDPVAWGRDRMGEHFWSKQAEVLQSVADNVRTGVKSCHGVGKSFGASRAGLWWIDTCPPDEERFLVTTAPSWPQVKTILWRYMKQGHTKGQLAGRILDTATWKIAGEEVGYGRKPADHDATGFQGIHATEGVLIVLDEACGIPHQLFVAADSLATNETSRVLAIGNPDDNSAHFARVCDGTDQGWNVITISAFDSPNLTGEPVPDRMAKGLVSEWWVRDKQLRWGEQNPLYIAKVLGEFADSDDGLIPLSWVKQAHQRWYAWQDERQASKVRIEPAGARVLGVDVAWRGEDKTAIAVRQGDVINPDGETEIETHAKLATYETTDRIAARLDAHPGAWVAIDVAGGYGAGPYDELQRRGYRVYGFNASNKTKRRDITGLLKFPNVRSASWWNLRELLDPAAGATLALPPDDDLTADLITPKWAQRTGGVIEVESKDEITERLGHSPDVGDAVVIACWADRPQRGADRADAPEQVRAAKTRARAPIPHQDVYEAAVPEPVPAGSGDVLTTGWTDDDAWL